MQESQRVRAWSLEVDEVLRLLGTARGGLDASEAHERRLRDGPNRLREHKSRSLVAILVAQLQSVLVVLLALAVVASFAMGRIVEGVAVALVIVLDTVIGFAMEARATRSMEALRQLGQVTATVRRSGEHLRVPASELAIGDLVIVEAGDIISADLRIVEASKLQVDESLLTGESLPVEKGVRKNREETLLAERSSMLFSGTSVTRGAGEGVVAAIGMGTELGQISRLVAEVKDESTPLERRLEELGRKLSWITLGVAFVVAVVGVIGGRPPLLILETSVALAVATVPEGLPIVATLALARGMARMARRNALCAQLSVVETLGATSVILTDKTGTLTQNRLAVEELVIDHQRIVVETSASGEHFFHDGRVASGRLLELLRNALRVGVLCNDAHLAPGREGVGEPLEVALLLAGAKAGLEADELNGQTPEVREEAFDPQVRMMATFHQRGGSGFLVAVKGAPEAVVAVCRDVITRKGIVPLDAKRRSRWLDHNQQLASRGLRVLALAERDAVDVAEPPYEHLTLLGLVAMADPPRSEVRQVIEDCRAAGVRVVMVTGDQAPTALRVAESVGLVSSDSRACVLGLDHELSKAEEQQIVDSDVIARASPRQKLEVLGTYQKGGAVVAMLGDGVNDAPALRRANIGVAMGRGTQVAREASDLVLNDDRLSTVVVAIGEGRIIFENIRKFALYLLSCNASELGAVGVAALIGLPLPVLPLQILFLNLVTDVFPALALGACEGQGRALRLAPRPPGEGVLERRHWWAIAAHGGFIAALVLGSLIVARSGFGFTPRGAVSVSFATLGFSQLTHVFNMRGDDSPGIKNEVTRNLWVWGAVFLCVGLLLAALYLPPLAAVLDTEPLDARAWAVVFAGSLLTLPFGVLVRRFVGQLGPESRRA